MDFEKFEDLWSRRESLSPELKKELEEQKKSSRLCRDYAEGGYSVREMLKDLEPEEAPKNFAYQMRVYAKNHPETSIPLKERPVLKWGSLGVGLAAGAMMLAFIVGPGNNPFDTGLQSNPQATKVIEESVPEIITNDAISNNDELNLASVPEESLKTDANDSTRQIIKDHSSSHTMDIRTVSTDQ